VRRWILAAIAVFALAALVFGGARWTARLDPERLAGAARAELQALFGAPVSWSSARVGWFPVPHLELASVRIGVGDVEALPGSAAASGARTEERSTGGGSISGEVELVSFGLGWWPLSLLESLSSREPAPEAASESALESGPDVALRSVVFQRPKLLLTGSVDASASGVDMLRALLEAAGAREARAQAEGPAPGGTPLVAVAVRGGSLRLGELALDALEFDAVPSWDRNVSLEASARLEVAGRALDAGVTLTGQVAADGRWDAVLELADLDLAELRHAVDSGHALFGRVGARVEAAGQGQRLKSAELRSSSDDLDARIGQLRLRGGVEGVVSWDSDLADSDPSSVQSGSGLVNCIELDLSAAEVGLGGAWKKRSGLPARLRLPAAALAALAEGRADRVRGIEFVTGESRLRGSVRWVREGDMGGPVLTLEGSGRLPAELFGGLLPALVSIEAGALSLDSARVELDRDGRISDLEAYGTTEGVAMSLRREGRTDESLALDGSFELDTKRVLARGLALSWREQRLLLDVAYGFRSELMELRARAEALDLARLSEGLSGKATISGPLYAELHLAGPPRWDRLRAVGRLEVPGGELAGASLEELLADSRASDTEQPDRFRRLAMEFALADQVVDVRALEVQQGAGEARLQGTLSLFDGSVELAGMLRAESGPERIERSMTVRGILPELSTELGEAAMAVPERIAPDAPLAALEAQTPLLAAAARERNDPPVAEIRRLQRESLARQLREIEAARQTDASRQIPRPTSGQAFEEASGQNTGPRTGPQQIGPQRQGAAQ